MTTMQIWRERARANVTPRLPEIQSSKRKLRLRRGMGERALRSKPDSGTRKLLCAVTVTCGYRMVPDAS